MFEDEHVITSISRNTAFTREQVREVFWIVKSYDDTIKLLELSCMFNISPVEIWSLLDRLQLSVSDYYQLREE